MKERLLHGWNIQRLLYVLLGGAIIIQSATNREWFGVLLGSYFSAMGLFAFGCAGGNCYGSQCSTKPEPSTEQEKISYQEMKQQK